MAKRDLFMAAGPQGPRPGAAARPRDLGPLLAALVASVGVLALEKDLGNSLLIFGIVLVMIYIATERAAWVIIGLVPFIGGCLLAFHLFTHVQQRVANWLDPFATYSRSAAAARWPSRCSAWAPAASSAPASAPGPEPGAGGQYDFITAAIGEELGLSACSR